MKGTTMTSTLPRRTAAVTAIAVTAFSGAALAGAAVSASASAKAHTSLSIRAAKAVINPGGGDFVSGQLRSPAGHTGGVRITLLEKAKGATSWTRDARHRTGPHGQIGFQVVPAATTRYKLAFYGNKVQQGSRSGVVVVRVADTTSLTIAVGQSSIDPGASDTVSGVLSLDGTPLVGDTVNLLGAQRHHKLASVGSMVTGADGSVSFSVTPAANSRYVLVFDKTGADAGARSAVAAIIVRQPSSLSIRARLAKKTGSEVISGDLRGGGHNLAHRKVTLQDQAVGSDSWTTVATKLTGHAGGVGFTVPAPSASEAYQLVFSGGPLFEGCQSGVVTVTVG
jgi:hypothetical protein